MLDSRQDPCPNCPCCEAARYCDGCWETLCLQCWAEHNENAPCHSCDDDHDEDPDEVISKEQFILLLGISPDLLLDPKAVPEEWRRN